MGRRGEDVAFTDNYQGDDAVTRIQPDATDVRLAEPDGLAAGREQQDVPDSIGDRNVDEFIVTAQIDGDDAAGARPGERRERRLLHRARRGRHEHVLVVAVLADRQNGRDPFVRLERQQVDDRPSPGAPARLGQLIDLQPVDLAVRGEAQQRVVTVGHEQLLDEILFLHAGGGFPAPTAPLRLVGVQRLRLGVPAVRERDDPVFLRDQVLQRQVDLRLDDLGPPFVAELVANFLEFVANHRQQLGGICQCLS